MPSPTAQARRCAPPKVPQTVGQRPPRARWRAAPASAGDPDARRRGRVGGPRDRRPAAGVGRAPPPDPGSHRWTPPFPGAARWPAAPPRGPATRASDRGRGYCPALSVPPSRAVLPQYSVSEGGGSDRVVLSDPLLPSLASLLDLSKGSSCHADVTRDRAASPYPHVKCCAMMDRTACTMSSTSRAVNWSHCPCAALLRMSARAVIFFCVRRLYAPAL